MKLSWLESPVGAQASDRQINNQDNTEVNFGFSESLFG